MIRRGTQVAQGRGLQNLHSWVRIPPAPPSFSFQINGLQLSSLSRNPRFGNIWEQLGKEPQLLPIHLKALTGMVFECRSEKTTRWCELLSIVLSEFTNKRFRFSENLNWLFSGDSDSIYFRGLEKGKRQKESLEGAAGDYAVSTIQSCILNRMSFLEVTEPRCAAQAWKERTTCKCTPVNGLEATPWSHALLLGYLFLKRDFLDMCDHPGVSCVQLVGA